MYITIMPKDCKRDSMLAIASMNAWMDDIRSLGWPSQCVAVNFSMDRIVLLGDDEELPFWAELFTARFGRYAAVEVTKWA